MQIHDLKRKNKNKKSRIVGRGGKHAKTSGRGGKGQTARAGHKRRPELRVIIKKIPKLRGYRFNSYKNKPITISLDKIAKFMPEGGAINPDVLINLGLVKKEKGFVPVIKILSGKGDFNLKIECSNVLVSKTTKAKIEKALGKVVE